MRKRRTWADVTVISTSPREALISSLNFAQMPCSRPRRLFSARVARKFLTVSLLPAAPIAFCSSATTAFLSPSVRVGVLKTVASLASLEYSSPRALRAFAVGSRVEVFTAAVYYRYK